MLNDNCYERISCHTTRATFVDLFVAAEQRSSKSAEIKQAFEFNCNNFAFSVSCLFDIACMALRAPN